MGGETPATVDVAELWVVDLAAGAVVVHRGPSPEGYADVRAARGGDIVAPAAFPDVTLAVRDVLATPD